MPNASRVFVVQRPSDHSHAGPVFDFTPAERFGDIEVLLPNGKHILTPDVFSIMIEDNLRERNFDPDTDFIITTGDYSVLFFVGMIIARKFGYVRVLRWVAGMKAYQPLLLDVRGIYSLNVN